jgi:3-hydroxyacyl-[acyl-carrier-protein] dehydratase
LGLGLSLVDGPFSTAMPPQLLFEISGIDLNKDAYDQEVVRQFNPQRGQMEMLNGVVFADDQLHRLVGYKNVRMDEFWVPGHIPGRPLLPGVLMLELAAQLASFYAKKFIQWNTFIGFGGVEDCRFRQEVAPPTRLYVLGEQIWRRHGRIFCRIQGLNNGTIVFETKILGVQM